MFGKGVILNPPFPSWDGFSSGRIVSRDTTLEIHNRQRKRMAQDESVRPTPSKTADISGTSTDRNGRDFPEIETASNQGTIRKQRGAMIEPAGFAFQA
jgi:hypothetical protein